ncbi:MAG: sodium/proline symporter [Phycisphaerae bacterium]|nr:sodium/proline symporter [Phycisphaerae bacterium]
MSIVAAVNTTVVAASFAVYTLGIIAIGIYSARFARRSDEDYFLAGRSLGSWVAALSASASSESGWVTLGLVGWAFASGVSAYWIIPGCLLGFLFNWFIVAGRMNDRSRQLSALTLPDFFAFNFQERLPLLRILAVIVILVAMLLYVAAQLAAAGKAFLACFSDVEGMRYQYGVLIGAGVVLLYTVAGGFRAVCWTDFAQALLMVGTLILFPIYLLASEGGYGFITEQLRAIDGGALLKFTPDKAGAAMIGFLLGHGALGINFGYPGQPHVLVRFMALKQRREAMIGGIISFVWGLFVYWGAVTVGLMARAMTAAGEDWGQVMVAEATKGQYKELGLVLSAMNMLPGALAGLVLAAVLAAICSTADSQLVVAASAAANDLYARLFKKAREKSHMLANRLVVLAIGVAAVLLVIDEEVTVYEYVLNYGWAILGASFGPQVILVLLWKRASYAGCLAGMAAGFATAIIWQLTYGAAYATGMCKVEVYNLPLAFITALIVNVVVSLLAPGRPTRAEGKPRGGFPVVEPSTESSGAHSDRLHNRSDGR